MLHDQTNFCMYSSFWKRKYGLLWTSRDVEISAFDSSQSPGLPYPVETNTNSWLFSDITEQDLTAVIGFVNLCFDFTLNPFRFVLAQSDLGGCDAWNYGWGKKWTINNNLNILTISEVSKFLYQQFSKLAISSTFAQFLRTEDSSYTTKESRLKVLSKASRDLTLTTIFSTLSRDFC